LGKRTQNQSLMIGSCGPILANVGSGYSLILLVFFPHMEVSMDY
jgi:hypothetical protein